MIILKNFTEKYNKLPLHIRASVWYFICSFLQKGISVLSTPIFTRLLTTEEYGEYNVFNSWLGIVSIFITLRLYYGVYEQGLIKFEDEREAFTSSLQGLTLTMISAWTAIYLIFRSFWNSLLSLTTVQMLSMLVMTWTTAVYNFWATEQRVKLNYQKLVIITCLVTISKPVIGIIFVINAEDKVTARILGLVLVELIAYSWMFVAQMKRGKKFFSGKIWKYVIGFNLPLVPHYLSQVILSSSDRIMISKMISEDVAGIYSLAYSISMIMGLFNTALSQTLSPWILQKIKVGKVKETESIGYISLSIIAGVNLVLIAFAPEAVALFAPIAYHDAIWVIPPVAMSVYFMYAYDLFSNIEFYYEKTKFIMVASMLAAILNVILNYVFIGMFSYYAAGYTTLFCYMVYAISHYLFMRHISKIQMHCEAVYKAKKLFCISGIFLLLGFLFTFTYNFMILRYLICAFILAILLIKHKTIIRLIVEVISKKKEV